MNKDNIKNLIRSLRSIQMTSDEKTLLRKNLMSSLGIESKMSTYYKKAFFLTKNGLVAAFVFVLALGSLTHSAAGKTLPGDDLYPIKIMYEELRSATTLNSEKKISYEIERTEKRMQEASKLVKENKLDEKKKEMVTNSIKKQTEKIKNKIKEVTDSDPTKALSLSEELSTTIANNIETLKKVSEKDTLTEPDQNASNAEESSILPLNELDISLEAVDITSEPQRAEISSEEISLNQKKKELLLDSLVESMENEISSLNEQKKVIQNEIENKNTKDTLTQTEPAATELPKKVLTPEEEAQQKIRDLSAKIEVLKKTAEEKQILGEDFLKKEALLRAGFDASVKTKDWKQALEKIVEIYNNYEKLANPEVKQEKNTENVRLNNLNTESIKIQ